MGDIVYVAVLTYRRPDLLRSLLANLSLINNPEDYEVRYLIIDNDPNESARSFVEDVIPRFEAGLSYIVEPTPGIPSARNRAISEAIGQGARMLAFIDDDEAPQTDWLERLVQHVEATGSVLVGGPVRRTLPNHEITPFQKFLGRSLIARRTLGEWRAKRATPGVQIIYTGNWICDLDAVARHDLRFDTSMQFSGGTDAAFFFETVKRGLPVGWCPDAIVTEPIPPDRLTCSYVYGRGRAQGIVMAGLRPRSLGRTLLTQTPYLLVGAVLLIVPALGLASFATGLHLIGAAVGHLAYLAGKQSQLYARD